MNLKNACHQHMRSLRHTFKVGGAAWFLIALFSAGYAFYSANSVSKSGIFAATISALVTVGDRVLSHLKNKKQEANERRKIPGAVKDASECMADISNLSKNDITEFFKNVLEFGCKNYFPEDVKVRAAYYALEAREFGGTTEDNKSDYYLNKLAEYCWNVGFSEVIEPDDDNDSPAGRMIQCARSDKPVVVEDVLKKGQSDWSGRDSSHPSNQQYQSFISFPIHFSEERRSQKTKNIGMGGLLCIDAPEPYNLTRQDLDWAMALSTMIKNGIMFWNHKGGSPSRPRPKRPAHLSVTPTQKGHQS